MLWRARDPAAAPDHPGGHRRTPGRVPPGALGSGRRWPEHRLIRRVGHGGRTVRPIEELEDVVAATQASIGVITTPAEVAQSVCDRLAAAGVRSVLNFAPVTLAAPEGVDVRKVDLSVELQVLAFVGQQKLVGESA